MRYKPQKYPFCHTILRNTSTVSYAAAHMRGFLGDIHLPLSLSITIGSVVLTSSIYLGAILDFSTRMEFVWGGENLRVPWCLVQFIVSLKYKLLSFLFGTLSFGCSCIKSPSLIMKYWMLCLLIIFNSLS